jgi:beta-mannosidase
MGSLYWQLNDCWPVASWSSLDYYGRWKALHYIAKRVYQPFFASVKEERDSVEFWLTNDTREIKESSLIWSVLNSEGETLIKGSRNVRVSPCCSLLAETIDVEEINREKNYLQNIIFFTLEDHNKKIIYRGFRLFDNPKQFQIKDPEILHNITELKTKDSGGYTHKIQISSKNIALYVLIDSDTIDFIASDNYFSMEPGETRDILLKGIKNGEIKDLNELIEVKSLYNLV